MATVAATGAAAAWRARISRPVVLPVVTIVLVGLGLVMILSASSVEAYKQYGSSFLFFKRQLIGAIAGMVALVLMARMDYRVLKRFARLGFVAAIVSLVAVLIPGIGVTRGGSSRWFVLGPLSFQPSEMAKLCIIVFAAYVLESKGRKIFDLKEMVIPVLPATGLICLLVIAQPDLGTAIICAAAGTIVLFLAGARLKHMAVLGLGGVAAVLMLALTEGYRRDRIFGFLDPWADPLDTGYQNIQGQIALGSGGWFGVGLGASRQKWSYVPNAHTDFIYSIIGEELGLAGTMFVLAMFVLLVYVGVRIARKAPDRFGFLLAGGITGWIGVQALVNIGAVSGMLPITGVPLPMISFGGSSLVFTLAAVGILVSISRGGKVVRRGSGRRPSAPGSRRPSPK